MTETFKKILISEANLLPVDRPDSTTANLVHVFVLCLGTPVTLKYRALNGWIELRPGVIVTTNDCVGFLPPGTLAVISEIIPNHFFGDGEYPVRLALKCRLLKPQQGIETPYLQLCEINLA